MRRVGTVVFLLLLAVVAIPATALIHVWIDAGAVISKAEQKGLLQKPQADSPLTIAEKAIAIAEFENTWNVRSAPCRPVASSLIALSQPEVRAPNASVSTALSTVILMELAPDRSLRWQLKRLFAACQLEHRYSDTQMLRAWSKRAYFGALPVGIEAAAQSLFGKNAADLDRAESARLAVLLRSTYLRKRPEQWNERARLLEERMASSSLR